MRSVSDLPFSSSSPRRLSRLLAATLLALAAAAVGVSPAFAVDNGQVGIRPSNEPNYFHINLAPGAAIDETAVISNHTATAMTLLTYPVDGLTTPQGAFSLAAQSSPRENVGAWAHVATKQVTVGAHAEQKVPFHLAVPANATPGDYYGGLIIQSPPESGKTVTVSGTAVKLSVVQREGVRIYLTVAGSRRYTIRTGTLSWRKTSSGADFALPVQNQGNTILHPKASMILSSTVGASTKLAFNTPESLLPGDSITLRAHLPRLPMVQIGNANATVRSEAGTEHRSTSFTSIPWLGVGILLLVLVVLVFAGIRFARFLTRARAALAATENQLTHPEP